MIEHRSWHLARATQINVPLAHQTCRLLLFAALRLGGGGAACIGTSKIAAASTRAICLIIRLGQARRRGGGENQARAARAATSGTQNASRIGIRRRALL